MIMQFPWAVMCVWQMVSANRYLAHCELGSKDITVAATGHKEWLVWYQYAQIGAQGSCMVWGSISDVQKRLMLALSC